jgi:hypothetical protein
MLVHPIAEVQLTMLVLKLSTASKDYLELS